MKVWICCRQEYDETSIEKVFYKESDAVKWRTEEDSKIPSTARWIYTYYHEFEVE